MAANNTTAKTAENLPLKELPEILEELRAGHTDLDLFALAVLDLEQRLHQTANAIMDEYHEDRREAMRELPKNQWGFITARCYLNRSGGLRIEWLRQDPFPNTQRAPNKPAVHSNAIPFKGIKTPRALIKANKHRKYELALFDTYEPQFAMIRDASLHLGKVKRNLIALGRRVIAIEDLG